MSELTDRDRLYEEQMDAFVEEHLSLLRECRLTLDHLKGVRAESKIQATARDKQERMVRRRLHKAVVEYNRYRRKHGMEPIEFEELIGA